MATNAAETPIPLPSKDEKIEPSTTPAVTESGVKPASAQPEQPSEGKVQIKVPLFPIKSLVTYTDGTTLATPAHVNLSHQRQLAQMLLAFESNKELVHLQTAVTQVATSNPTGGGRRITIIVDPQLPVIQALTSPEFLSTKGIKEAGFAYRDPFPDTTNPELNPTHIPVGAPGANAVVEAIEENLAFLQYGEDMKSSKTFKSKDAFFAPCYMGSAQETLMMRIPQTAESEKVVANLRKSRAETSEVIKVLNDEIFRLSQSTASAKDLLSQRSDEVADAYARVKKERTDRFTTEKRELELKLYQHATGQHDATSKEEATSANERFEALKRELENLKLEEGTPEKDLGDIVNTLIADCDQAKQKISSIEDALFKNLQTNCALKFYNTPASFTISDNYVLLNPLTNLAHAVSEDTVIAAALTLNQPMMPSAMMGAMLQADCIAVRIVYLGDQSFNDMLLPPSQTELQQDETLFDQFANKFDIETFVDRLAEQRQKTLKHYRDQAARLTKPDKTLKKKSASTLIKRVEAQPTVIHFWMPTLLVSDFFQGIHEFRAKHFTERRRVLRGLDQADARKVAHQ